jgi:hypothetical protein
MGLMETGPIRLDTLKICPQLLRYYLNKSYPKMRKKNYSWTDSNHD